MNKKTVYRCLVAVGLIVIFFLSESVGIQLDITDLIGGLF